MIRTVAVAIDCSCKMRVLVGAGQDDDVILASHLKAIHGMPNPFRFIYAFRFQNERAADGRLRAIT